MMHPKRWHSTLAVAKPRLPIWWMKKPKLAWPYPFYECDRYATRRPSIVCRRFGETRPKTIIKNSKKYYPIYSQNNLLYNGITEATAMRCCSPINSRRSKTGHTDEAGYCLVASSKRGDMRLISVIMGTKSVQERADQSRNLLNWGFSNFATKIAAPAQKLRQRASQLRCCR